MPWRPWNRSRPSRLYRASGGREASAFTSVPIEELRDSLDFLLYDTIKLEGRFDECVNPDGAYKLQGAGKEFVSWLLCLRNPGIAGRLERYCGTAVEASRCLSGVHESRPDRYQVPGPLGISGAASPAYRAQGLHRSRYCCLPRNTASRKTAGVLTFRLHGAKRCLGVNR